MLGFSPGLALGGRARSMMSARLWPIAAGILCALTNLLPLASAEAIKGERPQAVEDRFVPDPPNVDVRSWVEGLEAPWSLLFLPDGRALVSERAGRVRLIEANGSLRREPYTRLEVVTGGEAGLMGLALHPRFPAEPFVYAMLTRAAGSRTENAVVRLRDEGDRGAFDRVILGGIPAGRFHDGGRIAFGPDGMLYIGTGDATEPRQAQELVSLGGKILRVSPEGAVPRDNPFPGSAVYSLGHRNVQGLAWQPGTGDLFAAEHGPTGEFGLHARDELNLIRPGANYGWPEATCAAHRDPFVDPLVCWPEAAVPPGGIGFFDGGLFVATMRSEALIRVSLARSDRGYRVTEIERWFATGPAQGRYGRLRDVAVGPDHALYVLTSNRDGRGRARVGDDRILRIASR